MLTYEQNSPQNHLNHCFMFLCAQVCMPLWARVPKCGHPTFVVLVGRRRMYPMMAAAWLAVRVFTGSLWQSPDSALYWLSLSECRVDFNLVGTGEHLSCIAETQFSSPVHTV